MTGLVVLPGLAIWDELQFGREPPPFASYMVVTPNAAANCCLAEITASGKFW